MRRLVLYSGLVLTALACSKQPASTEPAGGGATGVDPLAGRTRYTIVYGGNMWGDLLECG